MEFATVDVMINLSKLKWIFAVILLISICAVASYYFYWYIKLWQGEGIRKKFAELDQSTTETDPAPKQLSTEFDPAENLGVYTIVAWDDNIRQIILTYEWPSNKKNEKIYPILTCSGLSQIFELDARVPKYVTLPTLFEIIQSTQKSQMILSGRCSDGKCSEMNRECTLKIIREKYVGK